MKKFLCSTIAASLLLVTGAAVAKPFDFDYQVAGSSTLTQAFDNGSRTFIQLRNPSFKVDLAFGVDASGERKPVAIVGTAPYIEINGTYRSIELISNGKTYAVQYTGNNSRNAPALLPQQQQFETPSFAAVATTAPAVVTSPRYQAAHQISTNEPVAAFGAAKPLILGEEEHNDVAEVAANPLTIPFVMGKTTLGPKARSQVKALAETAKRTGQTLAIAMYSDQGAGKEQAIKRGKALKEAFAKLGVKNIDWRFGGELAANNGLLIMKVAFLKQPTTETPSLTAASVVTPAMPPVQSANQVPAQASATVMPQPTTAPTANSDEVSLQESIAKERAKLEASIKNLETLKSQGIFTDAEFQPAKARLESASQQVTAPLEAKLKQIQIVREAESRRIEQERQASIAAAAVKQSEIVPVSPQQVPLSIKVEPIWAITEADSTLRGLLDKWAKAAGWTLVWKIGSDYSISAKATLKGSLDLAINQVLASIQSSEYPIVATFYEGNKTIKIDIKE